MIAFAQQSLDVGSRCKRLHNSIAVSMEVIPIDCEVTPTVASSCANAVGLPPFWLFVESVVFTLVKIEKQTVAIMFISLL